MIHILVSRETSKMVWYSHLFQSFPWFIMTHIVEGFGIVDETEVDVFLEFPSFLYDPVNVGYLIFGSSSFSKPSLGIWMFLVLIMLNPRMQDFRHDLTSMGNECNCPMVNTSFSMTLLGNWDEDWPFPVLWVFQICWHVECNTLMASSFMVLNSSTQIPSHPLVLLTAVVPKALLTLLSRISDSGWLITPS